MATRPESDQRRSVLIVTSDFPPLAGTNTQRVQSFVRHLPAFGWRATVVTQAIEDMEMVDSRDLERLPSGVQVIRIPSPDPFRWYRRKRGGRPIDVTRAGQAAEERVAPAQVRAVGQASDILKVPLRAASRVAKNALRRYWYVPDPLMPWADAAARASIDLLGSNKFDCLLTSAPSYSSHVAGLKIKLRTQIPWIADFRDLWVGRPYRSLSYAAHEKIDAKLESDVLRHADRVIVASPPWRDVFGERYGADIAAKTEVITNGFEVDSPWPPSPMARTSADTIFVYTGVMEGAESPEPFLRALKLVGEETPEAVERIRVRFIGPGAEVDRLRALVSGTILENRIEFLGVRPHAECVSEQARADVLLLLSGEKHVQTIRGKSFEYMATGKAILAVIPEHGTQAEFLRKAGTAVIVSPSNEAAIREAIRPLLTGTGARTLQPDWDYIRQFDRRSLTEKLAGILLECADGRPPSGLNETRGLAA